MFNACVVNDVHTGTLHRRKNLVNAKAHVDVTRGLIGFRPMKSRIATDKAWKAIMERVNQLRDTGATYAELGKMLGTSAATVNRWVNEGAGGESTPFSNMLHYMEVLGLAWDDVLVGFSPSDCGYGYVRKVQARLGAGSSLITNGDVAGMYAFRQDFINELGGSADSLVLFDVMGDSMEPTIPDGSAVLVNMRETDVRSGLIYAIRVEEELMVKRLFKNPGKLVCKSDNEARPDIIVEGENPDFSVFGRVRWTARRM